MAMTVITAGTTLAAGTAFPIAGVVRLRADNIIAGQFVEVYEETSTPGAFARVRDGRRGVLVELTSQNPSILLEGYGNYKCVVSNAAIVVAYDAG